MGQPLKFVDYFRHTIAPSAIEMGTSSVPLASATNEQEWLGCYFESSGQTSYGMRIQIEKTSATAGAPRALTLRTILGHSSGLAPQGANSVDARVTLETGNTGISGEMHAMESQCRVDGESRGVNGTYAAHKFTNNFGALNTMPTDTFFLRFYDAGTVKTPRLFGFTGLTAGTGNLYYNETLKIKVNTNDRWIPLSTAQGTYTSAYAVSLGLAAGSVLSFTGAATNLIDFNVTGATCALHFVDAFTGKVIETGTYESNVDKGVILSSTNYRPVSFLFDDSDATLGAANYRGVLSRIYVGHSQDGDIAIRGIRGQLKFKDAVDIEITQNQFGSINGVDGFIETAGTHTIGSKTRVAGVHGTIGIASGTVTNGHVIAGLMAELNINSTGSISGGITAGLYIDQVHSDHGLTCPWPYGIYIAASGATTGMYIGSCTTAIRLPGTYTSHALDFSDATQAAGDISLIRAGSYDSCMDAAGESQYGMMRLYLDTDDDGTSYNRGVFVCLKTSGTKGIFPVAGLAEVLAQSGNGPTKAQAAQFIAGLHTATSKLATIGADTTAGMYGAWLKVYSIVGSTASSGSRVAPVWLDNQMCGTVSGEEYTMFCTTGGTRPDAWAGFETTSSGWNNFLYFDETAYDQLPIVSATPAANTKKYLKVDLNGTAYAIPLNSVA